MNGIGDLRGKVGGGIVARGLRALPDWNRRTVLIGGGAAAGLAVAWSIWPRTQPLAINTAPGEQILGAFVKIGRDGRVTILVPQLEMGDGAFTLIAQLAADELGADWRTVAVEPAPLLATYANQLLLDDDAALHTPRTGVPDYLAGMGAWRRSVLASGAGAVMTGGSTLMRMYEAPVRESAAIARALLCMAAAQQWDAAWEDCDTQDGFVTLGQRRLRFGDLAAAAADMRPPSYPPVRALASGALFGQSPPRLDLPAKMDGNFPFAGDVRLPDLAYAAIRQGPIGDTRLISHDIAAATQVSGFLHAVTHDRWLAAVGTNSWAAQRALDAMAPVFRTTGPRADSDDIDRALASAVRAANGVRVVDEGDVAAAFDGRPVLGADYVVAPMQHVPMETRAATASVVDGHARLWVASQAPGACRAAVAAALGLAVERVTLFPMAAGGNSGVAMNHDVAVQAALIARATSRPIALMWSRTEEILRDLPRAPVRAAMRATLSSGASIDGWQASIAAPASRHEWRARVDGAKADVAMRGAAGRADAAMVAGARPPYIIPHCAVDHLPVDTGLPTGYVRGLADGYTAFFNEAFVDELAAIAGTDPFGFRMSMLAQQPDLARCLQTATALGGWLGGQSGSGQGLACHSMRGSHIAVMAVARPTGAGIAVERLIAAVDVGRVMNPDLVKQQIEGGLIFGLAGAVGATTRYAGGMARARRMGDMGLPTLAQSPEIVVEIIASNRDPGGHEELGMVCVAPAIANALFTISGQRVRRLPLSAKPLP